MCIRDRCDLASVLPILQRAKRVVIAGDPAQLRHVSFLATRQQAGFAEAYGLSDQQIEDYNFRANSLLDLATEKIQSHGQVAFLDEHFRSRPEIIQFSNQEFYRGKLRIMTGNHRCPHQVERSVPIEINRVTDGKRLGSGVNQREARRLLDDLVKTVTRLEEEQGGEAPISIGILSPFLSLIHI